MTSRIAVWLTALTVIAVLALPGRATARATTGAPYPYVLIDLGTFGGPQSYPNLPATPINALGVALGTAETTISDTDYPNFNPYMVGFPDPYIVHAFAWHRGVLTDLGALPGNNSSAIFELNAHGVGVGMSENGVIDPFTGWPADNATLWQNGQVSNLGTLPGGYESQAGFINERGQIAGFASNGIPDPFSMGGWATQGRVVLWQNGVMHDLGTLGGPDSFGGLLNERGQITGQSYTNAISNTTTGVPTQDPFLWQDGHMRDFGTLGGTFGYPNWINNRGEVVGQSNLVGDQFYHPFLWDGHRLRDLGTFGGNNGFANFINAAGDVVGRGDVPGSQTSQTHHAFLWKNGVMTDLGLPPGDNCDTAWSVNDADQVVGSAGICGGSTPAHAFLWEKGSINDVNMLFAPSDLLVTEANYINEQGEIAGIGVFPNGAQHVVLLVPRAEAEHEGLTSNAPALGTASPATGIHRNSATCAREPVWLRRPVALYRPPTC